MSLVLQLYHVKMSKYSKLGIDTFNTFWVVSYIKVFHNGDDLATTLALLELINTIDHYSFIVTMRVAKIDISTTELLITDI